MGELRDNKGARRSGMSQGSWLRRRGCTATWTSREVTVANIVHDKMFELWRKGASSEQLRDKVQARSGTICRRLNIMAPEKEGTTEFEFQNAYKS